MTDSSQNTHCTKVVVFSTLLAGAVMSVLVSAHSVYHQYNIATQFKRDQQSTTLDTAATIREISKDQENSNINRPLSDSEYEVWLQEMETIQNERQHVLRDACLKYTNQSFMTLEDFAKNERNLFSLIYSDKYKVIYNFVHKVASTNLATVFNNKASFMSHRLYKLKYSAVIKRLQNYKKIIFVRDPFARFISVYRDKFIENPNEAHFKSIAKTIKQQYRSADIPMKENLTFPEFLQYITGSDKHRRANTHWSSYLNRNKVCLLKHDFIGKLETMDDDSTYFSKEILGLDNSILEGPRPNTTTGHIVLINQLYSDVPKKTMLKLLGHYETDFKLFGYDTSFPKS